MSQYNVNPPPDGNDRTAAASINLVTVLIVLAVLVFLAWFLFAGPLGHMLSTGPTINVNPPAQQGPNININPPQQQAPQAPQAPQPQAPQPKSPGG